MGSLSRQRARDRVQQAVDQRLEEADSQEDREAALSEAVTELSKIAIDCGEMDRVSRSLATDPDDIGF